MEMSTFGDPFAVITLVCAAISAGLILYYLVRRPPLSGVTKLVLLAGLGIFPIMSAGSGNYYGFEKTTEREFCNGCHVMKPWVDDAEDPASTSLSALHARNELFGDKSCYTCHADYGMFGVAVTKMNGMVHLAHYLQHYKDVPVEEAVETIRIFKPFPNRNCMHCHSTTLPGYAAVPDHKANDDEEVSCTSVGCHGPAHPFAGGSRE